VEKYNKEYSMSQALAINHHRVDYLKEVEGRYDILLDGLPAELKKCGSNNMYHYASHVIKSQKAEIVVFEFDAMTSKVYQELNKLQRHGYKVIYFTSKEKVLHYINTTPR